MSDTDDNQQKEALLKLFQSQAYLFGSDNCERCQKERPKFLPTLRGWRQWGVFWLCGSCWATTHSTPTAWLEYQAQINQHKKAVATTFVSGIMGLGKTPTDPLVGGLVVETNAGKEDGDEYARERKLMKDAQRGESLGCDVDQLVAELIRIGERDGYLSLKPGHPFNEDNRHIRAREIGQILHERGGMDLMKAAFFRVRVARGSASQTDAGRSGDLEMAWHGVGDWLG